MYNRPDPRFNPMVLQPYVEQPRMDGQFLINYTLHKKREQLPGYEIPQVSEIFDGTAMFANAAVNPTEITVFRFLDSSMARYAYDGQNYRESAVSLTEAACHVAKLRFICFTPSFVDVGFEKLPKFDIYKWQNEVQWKTVYIFNGKNEVVGLDRDVQQIMKKILKGLQGLHGVNWCHGNLLHGYWFNTDHNLNAEVRFINFGGADDLAAGIKKDMKDFKDLLDWVIEANSPYTCNPMAQVHFWPPTDVHGFGEHVTKLIHEMDFETLRRKAYFIYNHPVFNNAVENYTLLQKIYSIKIQKRNKFDKEVTLIEFSNWHKRVQYGSYFWNDLKQNLQLYQGKPTYLLDFHINAVKHHKANNLGEETEDDDPKVICEELQYLFPGFVGVLYTEYAAFNTTNVQPWMESNDQLLESGIYAIN
ncbi:hypothetical protein RHMOL_Rhmol04G0048200 [Rhododendron molle]|uniref:Uncharacterized protein n=1 Tax=Rhododendron molle TaxID=49168 RepID=A0ACC0NXJ1_RHOML|nr:hypothetical protein RHMOL_Rhmol04G0048200 [Rhododendron molle]